MPIAQTKLIRYSCRTCKLTAIIAQQCILHLNARSVMRNKQTVGENRILFHLSQPSKAYSIAKVMSCSTVVQQTWMFTVYKKTTGSSSCRWCCYRIIKVLKHAHVKPEQQVQYRQEQCGKQYAGFEPRSWKTTILLTSLHHTLHHYKLHAVPAITNIYYLSTHVFERNYQVCVTKGISARMQLPTVCYQVKN